MPEIARTLAPGPLIVTLFVIASVLPTVMVPVTPEKLIVSPPAPAFT
jgi:hypothetical protein